MFANQFQAAPKLPVIWGLSYQFKIFSGREQELKVTHQLLTSYNTCVLAGPFGIGKSQLAIKYADDNKYSYKAVLYVKKEKIEEFYLTKLIAALKNNQIGKEEKILIIMDDIISYDHYEKVFQALDLPEAKYKFLICTRNEDFTNSALEKLKMSK